MNSLRKSIDQLKIQILPLFVQEEVSGVIGSVAAAAGELIQRSKSPPSLYPSYLDDTQSQPLSYRISPAPPKSPFFNEISYIGISRTPTPEVFECNFEKIDHATLRKYFEILARDTSQWSTDDHESITTLRTIMVDSFVFYEFKADAAYEKISNLPINAELKNDKLLVCSYLLNEASIEVLKSCSVYYKLLKKMPNEFVTEKQLLKKLNLIALMGTVRLSKFQSHFNCLPTIETIRRVSTPSLSDLKDLKNYLTKLNTIEKRDDVGYLHSFEAGFFQLLDDSMSSVFELHDLYKYILCDTDCEVTSDHLQGIFYVNEKAFRLACFIAQVYFSEIFELPFSAKHRIQVSRLLIGVLIGSRITRYSLPEREHIFILKETRHLRMECRAKIKPICFLDPRLTEDEKVETAKKWIETGFKSYQQRLKIGNYKIEDMKVARLDPCKFKASALVSLSPRACSLFCSPWPLANCIASIETHTYSEISVNLLETLALTSFVIDEDVIAFLELYSYKTLTADIISYLKFKFSFMVQLLSDFEDSSERSSFFVTYERFRKLFFILYKRAQVEEACLRFLELWDGQIEQVEQKCKRFRELEVSSAETTS